jgi:hypothetical protein
MGWAFLERKAVAIFIAEEGSAPTLVGWEKLATARTNNNKDNYRDSPFRSE